MRDNVLQAFCSDDPSHFSPAYIGRRVATVATVFHGYISYQ